MLIKTPVLMRWDVLRGFWDEGEPEPTGALEGWIAESDSDSDDPDYEDTHTQRGFFIRVVNTGAYISDSNLPDGYESNSSPDGTGAVTMIYPGPDHHHSTYSHAHLRDFSQTAIKQYNQDTGNKYELVELVKASVVTTVEAAFIQVIFKACQSDDTIVATSFRAEARSASKTLTGSYDIEMVAPLHTGSDISTASEFEVI